VVKFVLRHGDPYDFVIRENLESQIWIDWSVRASIRDRLLKIAQEFIEFLEFVEEDAVLDIQFTGSLANFNYTKYSDIDLHVIVDISKIDENEDLVKNYLKSKKNYWNSTHDIRIKDYEVELYAQDSKESHASTGVYSLLHDKWVIKPSRVKFTFDYEQIYSKVKNFQQHYYFLKKQKPLDYKKIEGLRSRLIKMRRSGLQRGGEFSNENLAFKVMRRIGLIGKIIKLKNEAYDQDMSLNS
tara:strand:+ start:1057 stop:1779 length:723 start_codon:yes stop_codon:yes gene_type:complete